MRTNSTKSASARGTPSHVLGGRDRLKAAHRRTACRLEAIFDTPGVATSRFMLKSARATVRRHVTRLANLVGVVSAVSVSETYTAAMFALYERQGRGEDVSKALRAAAVIRNWTDPRNFTPPPCEPGAGKSSTTTSRPETERERTRRELLDRLRSLAEQPEPCRLTRIAAPAEPLAAYGVRPSHVLRVMLDGDAGHGELAAITYYDFGRQKRIFYIGFLFVEGDHLCLRFRSPDECRADHYAPHELTVIGRVVRVERGGLPVRLNGLELRGLPFAEDAGESEEPKRRVA
jgi:hypothetical protein